MISYRFQPTSKIYSNQVSFALCLSCQNAETSRFAVKKELFSQDSRAHISQPLPRRPGTGGIDGIKRLGSLGCGEHEECEEYRQRG